MIISASRRTDIPAYYSDWFFNRIKAGYVYVRNPMNAHQVRKISLSPEAVDGIVFWTKNPLPLLTRLEALKEYMYYFQFTLTSYGTDIERHIPSKNKVLIPAFQRLSDRIGPDRVIWRYDPILINGTYTVDYHIQFFEKLTKRLSPYTKKCVISFLDCYRGVRKNQAVLSPGQFSAEQQEQLAARLAGIARGYGLRMETCAEAIELTRYGIEHARCIDDRLMEQLLQCPLDVKKDRNQRLACGCVESLDIGAYNTCRGGCLYCYANYREEAVCANSGKHNPESPLLIGEVGPADKITERERTSCKANQMRIAL